MTADHTVHDRGHDHRSSSKRALLIVLVLVASHMTVEKVFRVLLEATPPHLDMYRLCSALEDVEGVTLVHDVHA